MTYTIWVISDGVGKQFTTSVYNTYEDAVNVIKQQKDVTMKPESLKEDIQHGVNSCIGIIYNDNDFGLDIFWFIKKNDS